MNDPAGLLPVDSTTLLIELGIILALLVGWQFTLGEFVGGPLMIVFLALTTLRHACRAFSRT